MSLISTPQPGNAATTMFQPNTTARKEFERKPVGQGITTALPTTTTNTVLTPPLSPIVPSPVGVGIQNHNNSSQMLQQTTASTNPYQNIIFNNGYPSPIETPIIESPEYGQQPLYPANPQVSSAEVDNYFGAQNSLHYQQRQQNVSQAMNSNQQASLKSKPQVTVASKFPQNGNQRIPITYGSLASMATPIPGSMGSPQQRRMAVGPQKIQMDVKPQGMPQLPVVGHISHTRSFDSTVTSSSNASMWRTASSVASSTQATNLTASSSVSGYSRPEKPDWRQPTLARSMTEGSSVSAASSYSPTCHNCKNGKKNPYIKRPDIQFCIQSFWQPYLSSNA
jgi:hypothetical protein